MSRLLVGSRGIFFEKLTIFSPKTDVRSSRSNGWWPFGVVVKSSRRTKASFVAPPGKAHPTSPASGVWCFSHGTSLVFGAWCLDLFIWSLELFTLVTGYRFVQVQDHAANLGPGGQLGFVRAFWLGCEAYVHQLFRLVRIRPVMLPLKGQELFKRFQFLRFDRARKRPFAGQFQPGVVRSAFGGEHFLRKSARRFDEARVIQQGQRLLRRVGNVAAGDAFLAGRGVEVGQHR